MPTPSIQKVGIGSLPFHLPLSMERRERTSSVARLAVAMQGDTSNEKSPTHGCPTRTPSYS
jgi:hypothetical protein